METFIKDNEIYVKLPKNKVAKLEEFVRRYTRGGDLEKYDLDDTYTKCTLKPEYNLSEAAIAKLKSKKPKFKGIGIKRLFGRKG